MIPTPPGWSRQLRVHDVRLLPPADHAIGEIRYRERYGPLRSARDVAHVRLSTATAFLDPVLGEAERLVTHEGEYAALLPIRGVVGDNPVQRFMGVVFGDNFTTLLDAIAVDDDNAEELSDLVRTLTQQTTLMLGVRKRRFYYEAPDDWQPLPNVFVTNWYPPEFPRTTACITVYPATPTRPLAPQQVLEASVLEERAKGSAVTVADQPEPLQAQDDLMGTLWRLRVQPARHPAFTRDLVAFEDSRYIYPLRLDAYEGPYAVVAQRAFRELLDTVEPVPGTGAAPAPETAESVAFWIS